MAGLINKIIYLTIDIDFTSYKDGVFFDEIEATKNNFLSFFNKHKNVIATWFVRIDYQIETLFGEADYILKKHQAFFSQLTHLGHEIAWHHHDYVYQNNQWIQNINEDIICDNLIKYGNIALSHHCKSSRMGWGFHTNKTFKTINSLNFLFDSSAIPKPNYTWDLSIKNWEKAPQYFYYPSISNYQIEDEKSYTTLQIPINTINIQLGTDSQSNTVRYINPSYHFDYFKNSITSFFNNNQQNSVVIITHPSELISNKTNHQLLSFDFNTFKKNIRFLLDEQMNFEIIKNIKL